MVLAVLRQQHRARMLAQHAGDRLAQAACQPRSRCSTSYLAGSAQPVARATSPSSSSATAAVTCSASDHVDHPAPAALQQPRHHQHRRRDIGRRGPVGLGARQQADHEHHRQRRQGEEGEQRRAPVAEDAARLRHHTRSAPRTAAARTRRTASRRIRRKWPGWNSEPVERGVVGGMVIAGEAVRQVPREIGRIDREARARPRRDRAADAAARRGTQ